MEQIRNERGKTWVAVDAGNLLFENPSLSPLKAQQEKITAAGIVEAYKQMGYDAAGIGSNDLAAGLSYLQELQRTSAFTWLSANLVRNVDHTTVFPPYCIRSRGGVSVGIIGITGEAVLPQLSVSDGIKLLAWSEVLPALAKELAARCDMVILLSSMSTQENIEVARQLAGINLIIEATGGNSDKEPANVANTLIAHGRDQGKSLGILQVNWQPSKRWQQQGQEPLLAQKQAMLDRYNWQLKRIESRGNPDEQYKKTPELLASYQRLVAKRDAVATEVEELSAKTAAAPAAAMPCTYTSSFVAMETTLADDLKVLALVEKIKSDIAFHAQKKLAVKKLNSETTMQIVDDPAQVGYIGWKRCTGCHGEIVEKWQKTRHAKAYDSLVERASQFNLDCLPCHVTGIVSGNEPYILTLPEELLQVGCEVCHGPGQVHAANSSQPTSQKPDQTVCLRCHTPDQDDNFAFVQKSQLVH